MTYVTLQQKTLSHKYHFEVYRCGIHFDLFPSLNNPLVNAATVKQINTDYNTIVRMMILTVISPSSDIK